MQEIISINNISVYGNNIIISYSGNITFSWLENTDKHIPNVYLLLVNSDQNKITIRYSVLKNALKLNNMLKLVVSSKSKNIPLYINENLPIYLGIKKQNFVIKSIDNQSLIFETKNDDKQIVKKEYILDDNCFSKYIASRKQTSFQTLVNKKKLNLLIIGSCFSRSIFKSDEYFNPNYKNYFNVVYTAFHNSFLSLMSKPIQSINPQNIEDLTTKDVLKYVMIEFKKNLFQTIDEMNPDYIIIDNYIDANRPIIKLSNNQYITYNSYFSKSIIKRIYNNKPIIFPGTKTQLDLYRKSIKKLYKQLKKRQLANKVILLGCRLSERKIDTNKHLVEKWENPESWIFPTNNNWNQVDKIFLSEIPDSLYIDMRTTQWMSDISCPIHGGATPSHYQSEYYREIFNKLIEKLF